MQYRDSKVNLKELGTKTDGSSNLTFPNGGDGALLLLPNGDKLEIAACAGKVALIFTGKLLVIHKTLETFLNLASVQQFIGINIFSDSRSAF